DRLRQPGRTVRDGVLLGLVLAYQFFINEEILLLTVIGVGLFSIVWGLWHRAAARECAGRFGTGLGVAAAVSLMIVAFPLWYQFFGPRHYNGLPEVGNWGADLTSFTDFPTRSLAGWVSPPAPGVAQNVVEENTFYGWPLVLVGVALVIV